MLLLGVLGISLFGVKGLTIWFEIETGGGAGEGAGEGAGGGAIVGGVIVTGGVGFAEGMLAATKIGGGGGGLLLFLLLLSLYGMYLIISSPLWYPKLG